MRGALRPGPCTGLRDRYSHPLRRGGAPARLPTAAPVRAGRGALRRDGAGRAWGAHDRGDGQGRARRCRGPPPGGSCRHRRLQRTPFGARRSASISERSRRYQRACQRRWPSTPGRPGALDTAGSRVIRKSLEPRSLEGTVPARTVPAEREPAPARPGRSVRRAASARETSASTAHRRPLRMANRSWSATDAPCPAPAIGLSSRRQPPGDSISVGV